MKIAYVVDGSTDLFPSTKQRQDIYSVPFKGYNKSGTLVNITDRRHLEVVQDLETKQFVEPTPGIYRDLFCSLRKSGYDYIVCIPQKKTKSSSYKFAEYASRQYKDSVLVIDAVDYDLEPLDILNNLVNGKEFTDASNLLQITIDQLLDMVKGILSDLKLVTA